MSDLRDKYVKFFFSANKAVIELETVEIYHPNFSRRYYIVRNGGRAGIDAALETGVVVHFEYWPLVIRQTEERANLDYGLGIDLGDLGQLVPAEIKRVKAADAMAIPPVVIYRTYREDDLNGPMFGPVEMEVVSVPRTREGSSIEAGVSLNVSSTGEIYDLETFPGLRNIQ